MFQNDPYPSVFQNDPYPVFQNDPGPFLDLFEETPTGITRGISQAVQIFVLLFVKKMTGSEAPETI